MVQFKNAICSSTLDGEKSDFRINKKRTRKESGHEDSVNEDDLKDFCKDEENGSQEDADGFKL